MVAVATTAHRGQTRLRRRASAHPVAALPGGPILGALAAPIYYDATQGGRAFTDPDGDTLTYSLQFLTPSRGLVIQGTHVIGTLATPAVAALKIQALDGYGGVGEQTFWFAVVGPDPGRPFLPPVEYVYDELLLPQPLPSHFASVKKNRYRSAGESCKQRRCNARARAVLRQAFVGHQHALVRLMPSPGPRLCYARPLSDGRHEHAAQAQCNGLDERSVQRRRLLLGSDRGETLEAAVTRPIEDVHELGNSLPALEAKLAATDFYPASFHGGVRVTGGDTRPNSEGTRAVLAVDHLVSIDVRPCGGRQPLPFSEHFTRIHRRAAARSRDLRMGLLPWRLP